MAFSDLCLLIDERLRAETHFAQIEHAASETEHVWLFDDQAVRLRRSGSTGIEATYETANRPIHSRTFAASPLSVDRVVRTAIEHLNGYRVAP